MKLSLIPITYNRICLISDRCKENNTKAKCCKLSPAIRPKQKAAVADKRVTYFSETSYITIKCENLEQVYRNVMQKRMLSYNLEYSL